MKQCGREEEWAKKMDEAGEGEEEIHQEVSHRKWVYHGILSRASPFKVCRSQGT